MSDDMNLGRFAGRALDQISTFINKTDKKESGSVSFAEKLSNPVQASKELQQKPIEFKSDSKEFVKSHLETGVGMTLVTGGTLASVALLPLVGLEAIGGGIVGGTVKQLGKLLPEGSLKEHTKNADRLGVAVGINIGSLGTAGMAVVGLKMMEKEASIKPQMEVRGIAREQEISMAQQQLDISLKSSPHGFEGLDANSKEIANELMNALSRLENESTAKPSQAGVATTPQSNPTEKVGQTKWTDIPREPPSLQSLQKKLAGIQERQELFIKRNPDYLNWTPAKSRIYMNLAGLETSTLNQIEKEKVKLNGGIPEEVNIEPPVQEKVKASKKENLWLKSTPELKEKREAKLELIKDRYELYNINKQLKNLTDSNKVNLEHKSWAENYINTHPNTERSKELEGLIARSNKILEKNNLIMAQLLERKDQLSLTKDIIGPEQPQSEQTATTSPSEMVVTPKELAINQELKNLRSQLQKDSDTYNALTTRLDEDISEDQEKEIISQGDALTVKMEEQQARISELEKLKGELQVKTSEDQIIGKEEQIQTESAISPLMALEKELQDIKTKLNEPSARDSHRMMEFLTLDMQREKLEELIPLHQQLQIDQKELNKLNDEIVLIDEKNVSDDIFDKLAEKANQLEDKIEAGKQEIAKLEGEIKDITGLTK